MEESIKLDNAVHLDRKDVKHNMLTYKPYFTQRWVGLNRLYINNLECFKVYQAGRADETAACAWPCRGGPSFSLKIKAL